MRTRRSQGRRPEQQSTLDVVTLLTNAANQQRRPQTGRQCHRQAGEDQKEPQGSQVNRPEVALLPAGNSLLGSVSGGNGPACISASSLQQQRRHRWEEGSPIITPLLREIEAKGGNQ